MRLNALVQEIYHSHLVSSPFKLSVLFQGTNHFSDSTLGLYAPQMILW